jgi:transposase
MPGYSLTQRPLRSTKSRLSKKSTAAIGRSRGGLTTKVYAAVDALGNGLRLVLTPGQHADSTQLPGLLGSLAVAPGAVVADQAYDANAVRAAVARLGAEPVIPPKALRLHQRPYDANLYADRTKVERFFGRLKEARGFATRYEKTATSSLAVAHLLAALDWMR